MAHQPLTPDQMGDFSRGIVGTVVAFLTYFLSFLVSIKEELQVISLIVSIVVGLATLLNMMRKRG